MHEMGVTEAMMDVVLRHAEKNNAQKVTRINLVMGEMSTVVPYSVNFYFDMLSKDTVAEGAQLNFRKVKFKAKCSDCGKKFKPEDYDITCPKCKGSNTEIIAGREFQVESIEIS